MSVECCGKQWGTNFCPTCGKMLSANGHKPALLAFLRGHEKTAQTKFELREQQIAEGHARSDFFARQLPRLTALRDKWKSWADYVESLEKLPA